MQYLRSEGDIKSLGTEVTDGWELSCGLQESNLGPLEERPVLLPTETSLKPHHL